MKPPCTRGCPEAAHRHYSGCDYCGTCAPCVSYTPRRRFRWQIWRHP